MIRYKVTFKTFSSESVLGIGTVTYVIDDDESVRRASLPQGLKPDWFQTRDGRGEDIK
jgi:hypothetical protein